MPHLKPKIPLEKLPPHFDWAESMGSRLSAISRYSGPQNNYVYYVQNMNDITHVEQHYIPFRASVESGHNEERIKFIQYTGPHGHNPPKQPTFHEHVQKSIDWLESM